MDSVAVIGLGRMGEAVAERILDAGYPLVIFNRTPGRSAGLVGRGAIELASASEALTSASTCITFVSDDVALETVTLGDGGVITLGRPGTVLIDMSTVSVDTSRRVAAEAAARGLSYLRAPVSGNPGVVRAGELTIIVSGEETAFRRSEPLLRAIGPTVHYLGDGEQARVAKLALQILIAGTAELLAEAVALGERAGLERGRLLEVVGASAIGSPFIRYKSGPLVAADYSATFTTAMMLKDVDLVLGLASDLSLPLPLVSVLRGLLRDTAADGYADLDFMSLLLRLDATSSESALEESG